MGTLFLFGFHRLLGFWIFFSVVIYFLDMGVYATPASNIFQKISWQLKTTVKVLLRLLLTRPLNPKQSSKKQIPTPGIEPGPRRWERRILTTRPRGMCAGLVRVFGYCSVMWSCIDQPQTGVHICELSSLHYNSLMSITYFWSCCSAICHQTRAVCPPSDFNILKEIQGGNRSTLKRKKTKTGQNFKTIYIK